MRRFLEFIALIFLLPGAAMAQEIVDIGLSSPLTGPQALIGQDNRAGAEMAVNELNQKKLTIAGKPVTFRLLAEDDQANPKIGVAVAAKLIGAKVKAIVGPYNSDVAISASRLVNDAGIAMIRRISASVFISISSTGSNTVISVTPKPGRLRGDGSCANCDSNASDGSARTCLATSEPNTGPARIMQGMPTIRP